MNSSKSLKLLVFLMLTFGTASTVRAEPHYNSFDECLVDQFVNHACSEYEATLNCIQICSSSPTACNPIQPPDDGIDRFANGVGGAVVPFVLEIDKFLAGIGN